MEIKNTFGEVIFEVEGAKSVIEVITAAVSAGKNLCGANLCDADLCGANLRDAGKGIPVITNIHSAVFEAAARIGALNMGSWHSCSTTHCRAGWVIELAGAGGKALEWAVETRAAAALIYHMSDPTLEKIPDFYASNEGELRTLLPYERLTA